MPNYQLRFSDTWERIATNVAQLATRIGCSEWIAYEHSEEAARTHCHIYFFNTMYKEQTVRNHVGDYLRTHYDNGNKTYSLSSTAGRTKGPITLEGAIKYASRSGKLSCKHVAGYDTKVISKIESDFQEPDPEPKNEMIIPAIVKKPYQMTKWNLIEICMGEYEQFKKIEQREPSNRELVNLVIETLRQQKQVFSKYKVQEILYTIRANTDAYELENDLVKYLDSI